MTETKPNKAVIVSYAALCGSDDTSAATNETTLALLREVKRDGNKLAVTYGDLRWYDQAHKLGAMCGADDVAFVCADSDAAGNLFALADDLDASPANTLFVTSATPVANALRRTKRAGGVVQALVEYPAAIKPQNANIDNRHYCASRDEFHKIAATYDAFSKRGFQAPAVAEPEPLVVETPKPAPDQTPRLPQDVLDIFMRNKKPDETREEKPAISVTISEFLKHFPK